MTDIDTELKMTQPNYDELIKRLRDLEAAENERQARSAALRESEARYRRLVEELPILICSFLPDGTITFVNQAYCDYFGKTYTELVGANFLSLIPETDRQAVLDGISGLSAEAPTLEHEHPVLTPDGETRWQRWVNRARFDDQGAVIGYQSIGEDVTDMRAATQALKESERYLKRAQEAGKVGIWKLDQATNRVTMSAEFARIHGLDGNACQMDKLITLVPEGDRPSVQTRINAAIEATGEYDIEHRIIHQQSGDIRWVEARGRIVRDETGAVVAMTGTSQDITERKNVERVLRQKEEELDLIYNTTSDAMTLIQVNSTKALESRYRYASFNNAYWEVIHAQNKTITREALADMALPEMIIALGWPRELVDDLLEVYRVAIESGHPVVRVEILPHLGGHLYLNATYTPIFDAEATCTHILYCGHDITEIEEARLALAESEKMFRQVTETIQDVFWMSTPGITDIIYVSPAYEKIWESSRERLYQSPRAFIGAIDPQDVDAYLETIDECHAKGKAYTCEYRIQLESGNQRWIQERVFPVMDDDGQVIQMAGICTDISERKRAAEERSKLQAQLLQAQKMESIGSLAGGIAHDFNNILSSIIGFTELAIEDVPPDSMLADNLHEVFQSGIRAKKLVKQILSFARQSEEEIKPIQPSAIAKEVLKFLRSSIPSNIEIKSVIASDGLIMGNATQMHQILMNLCTNAAQAMETRGGRLSLGLEDAHIDPIEATRLPGLKSGDYLKIEIADSGCGIPPELMASIFEPYFTTKEPGEGTGLGLAVVHGIVDSYGGKIFVTSALDKGTVFHLYLPLAKTHRLERLQQKEALPTGTERILFVDDEAPIARIGSQILERLGYTVTTRTSSVEALEVFRSKPEAFDLVITDMTMPNMTGDELAEALAQIRPDIRVILCTGYSKRIIHQGTGQGAIQAVVYKPIVKADLAAIVREVLDAPPSVP